MKIVFVGPSLHGVDRARHPELEFRPPAGQADIFRAVEQGARVIGLIDGAYETVSAIWHKEILFALSQGVQVFGAASLGALRAAECAAFGMVGVGAIYDGYRDGVLIDDSDVALLHGPAELDYLPLSLPLVNIIATLQALGQQALLEPEHLEKLASSAKAVFFKDRTWKAIVDGANVVAVRQPDILSLLKTCYVNQKRIDAMHMMEIMQAAENKRIMADTDWHFSETSLFDQFVRGALP
jgi:hypothetical protein